jgi:hypothetical protein
MTRLGLSLVNEFKKELIENMEITICSNQEKGN